jgi:hypothetical protein
MSIGPSCEEPFWQYPIESLNDGSFAKGAYLAAMTKDDAAECRKNADECLYHAEKAISQPEREEWLRLAVEWLKLAQSAEQKRTF